MTNNTQTRILLLFAVSVLLITAPPSWTCVFGQPQQLNGQQSGSGEDPIPELKLTPEQREKIRTIREQTREERATINQRLRVTNRALEEALDEDNPDEALVEQRLRDVAAAHAAQIRMRVLNEVRIRRVLTPDQQSLLRRLRQARDFHGERPAENKRRRRNALDGSRPLPNQRNGLRPLFPRRVGHPRRARP